MNRLCVLGAVACLAVAETARAQRPADVAITGADYAFVAVAPQLAAGPTLFSFENKGNVRHEMILVRLLPGVTPDSAMRARQAGARPQTVSEAPNGILIAEAGAKASGRLLVDLAAGDTYLLICNFRDTPDKPPHTALGMIASFKVK